MPTARLALLLLCLLAGHAAAQFASNNNDLTAECKAAVEAAGDNQDLQTAQNAYLSTNADCLQSTSGSQTCDKDVNLLRDACAQADTCLFSAYTRLDDASNSFETTAYFCGPTQCDNTDDINAATENAKAALAVANIGRSGEFEVMISGCRGSGGGAAVGAVFGLLAVVLFIAIAYFVIKKRAAAKGGGNAASAEMQAV